MGREERGENGFHLLQEELPVLECSYERKDLQGSVGVVSALCSVPGDELLEPGVLSAR